MLKNRIITALILAPLVIGAIYLLPNLYFVAVIAGVLALACYEWGGFCGWSQPVKLVYSAAFLGLVVLLAQYPTLHLPLIQAGVGFWLLAIIAVFLFPRGMSGYRNPSLLAPLGLFVLSVAWVCIAQIHQLEEGPHWVVWTLLVVWGADIGAYFAGRAFGQRRLAVHVSPGKTWEGALGGLVLSVAVCGSLAVWWQDDPGFWLLITALLAVVSVFGDLVESMLKRSTGVKDSGAILPGHGGMLDRIDSVLAVLPMLAVVLMVREV